MKNFIYIIMKNFIYIIWFYKIFILCGYPVPGTGKAVSRHAPLPGILIVILALSVLYIYYIISSV